MSLPLSLNSFRIVHERNKVANAYFTQSYPFPLFFDTVLALIFVFAFRAPIVPFAKSGRYLSLFEKLRGSFARPKVLDPPTPLRVGSAILRFEGLAGWRVDSSSSESEESSRNLRFGLSIARGRGSLESLLELILKGRGLVDEDAIRCLRGMTTEGLELEGGETMPIRVVA